MLNNIAALLDSGAPAVGDYQSIQTYTVGSGGSSLITFSSIAADWKHLQLRVLLKPVNNNTWLLGQVNGVTTSKYAWHELYGNGATASAGGTSNQTAMILMDNISNTNFGAAVIDYLDYSNSNINKTVKSLAGQDNNGSGYMGFYSSLYWNNTNAITQIDLYLSSGNFAQYSSFALYGIK